MSGPSFNLTTISDWPSMRNLGGLLATTTSNIVSSSQNLLIHVYCTGFNRTRGGRVTLACIVLNHLTHLALWLAGGETIFSLRTVSPWDSCAIGESVTSVLRLIFSTWLRVNLQVKQVLQNLMKGDHFNFDKRVWNKRMLSCS